MAAPTRTTNQRKESSRVEHDVVENYADLINELRLLTTVSALLFGFLLAFGSRDGSGSDIERWSFFAAIIATATSTALFVLPSVYHRLQFPYNDWDKFQRRAHAFMMIGVPFLAAGFYFSLALAVWDRVEQGAFVIAAIPLVAVGVVLAFRREISPPRGSS